MNIVDELGKVREELADLKKQEAELLDQIKAWGKGHFEGDAYEAFTREQSRSTTDYKGICEELDVSPTMKAAHTKTTTFFVTSVQRKD